MVRLICPATGLEVIASGPEDAAVLEAGGFTLVGEDAQAPAPTAPAPAPSDKPDTSVMTLRELAAWCAANGVKTRKGWKKADYVLAIENL